jgi:hypothetical protein
MALLPDKTVMVSREQAIDDFLLEIREVLSLDLAG